MDNKVTSTPWRALDATKTPQHRWVLDSSESTSHGSGRKTLR